MLISCESSEKQLSLVQESTNSIRQNAVNMSHKHDSLVIAMLNLEKSLKIQKAKGMNNSLQNLSNQEICDVIFEVTGIRPVILTDENKPRKSIKTGRNTDGYPEISFDVDTIFLSDFAQSSISQAYLNSIDDVSNRKKIMSYFKRI